MTDLQLLFIILALLYFWECGCWVRRGSVAFRTWFGKGWRLRHPGSLLGNQQGGFVFAVPLPPLGTILNGSQIPLSLSPEGALAFVAASVNPGWRPAQSGALCGIADLADARAAGKQVRVKGEPWLKLGSASLAQFLAEHLRLLAQTPEGKRQAAVEKLARATLDERSVQARFAEFNQQTRLLRVLANTLVIYLFVLVPAWIWQIGFSHWWPVLLAGLLICTSTTATLFRRAHRQLYPDREDERFTNSLMVLLSPATAMRAHDLISRPLLEAFHPLTLARVLCPTPQFRQYATDVWRELTYPARPVCPRPEPVAERIERDWRAAMRGEVERFLERNGISSKGLIQPPKQADPSCQAYCPRCGAQYTAGAEICDDCGGIGLIAFDRTPAERA